MSGAFSDPNQLPSQPHFPHEQRRSGPGIGCFLIGCLGSLLLCLLLCGGAVWYASNNADRWIAGWAGQFIAAMVNEAEIPEQEKKEVIAQVDRVVQAYKNRQINQQDLERIMEELQESPIFALFTAYGLDQLYITPSGLSDEEKQLARRSVQRAMRGVLEKKISQEEFDAAVPDSVGDEDMPAESEEPPKSDESNPSTSQPIPGDTATPPAKAADGVEISTKDVKLTDEQVREFVGKLKKLADDAEIPDEDYQIDIGDEVKRVVDAALAGVKPGP